MIKHVKNYTDLKTTLPILKEDGCFVVENTISQEDLQLLKKEILTKCTEGQNYEFGKLYRGSNIESYSKNSPIYRFFSQQWMRDLTKAYTTQPFGRSIIATHDYINTNDWARQGWLHFDKQKSFKFFLYLTDVDASCGALNLSPGSVQEGEKLNKYLNANNLYESNRKLETSYPELVAKYPSEAIEGAAGTLIVFDTDTFHKGGVVAEGKERLIVRMHTK